MNGSSTSNTLKWIAGGLEAILAIPVLGGLIVISFAWMPLVLMLILHIVTLVFSANENTSKGPSILGIATSCFGWIPIVGFIMHVASAIWLLITAYQEKQGSYYG